MDPKPVLARGDQASSPEIRQVARGHWLCDPEAIVDVAHANLAIHEQTENAEPCAVRERFEQGLEGGKNTVFHIAIIYALTDIVHHA